MGYIGAHGVAALHRYKYSGVDHSYVAKYVLQPFWTRFVTVFPLWMPPNMITLMGFMFLMLSAFIGYMYSPQLDTAPPRWVHFAHGLLLFLYQVINFLYFFKIDVYARHLMLLMGSKLDGQVLPVHWGSCLIMDVMHLLVLTVFQFESIAFGSTSMCGRDAFWFWFLSAVPFYGATWEHYFTHSLILPVINGPTEGLMLIYTCHFFTALVGAEWWIHEFGKSVPFLSWMPVVSGIPTYKAALTLLMVFGVGPTVFGNVSNVCKLVRAKNGSVLRALAMVIPFSL
ncbi:hypothetical protein Ahy_A01g004045 isoform C [Arachis hypogaea]|uniref:Aminoalcoholphosphotransferase n=1 Tax=Arachis hypogaea TaxID=3818 RepID=A0A445EUP2_ARAHY|nr:hypothetical protein Ahy_A01g004045 isoform C [Arachis hypogaea]